MINPGSIKDSDLTEVIRLYIHTFGAEPSSITPLAGAGSPRRYFKITGTDGSILAATRGDDKAENRAFIELSHHLADECLLPVPRVVAVSDDGLTYLQTWAGDRDLLTTLQDSKTDGNFSLTGINLLEEAMRSVARIQYIGGRNLDYSICYPHTEMDRRLIRWDLNYCKYCFLKPSGIPYDEDRLQDDFDRLESVLMAGSNSWCTFMLRDFQSRNVMVNGSKLTVIDFQGGRRGPGAYDVASFLWQAKACYPDNLRKHLIDVYIDECRHHDKNFDEERFRQTLPKFVLFRILQTLGAYGFRGWVEHKPHFLQSVPFGADNLFTLFSDKDLAAQYPALHQIAIRLHAHFGSEAARKLTDRYRRIIPAVDNPLTVRVTSFSFKKGIPTDPTGNGGGFVFDCRAPHNPGRYEPYKKLTGLDQPVREFLEKDGEIKPFIEECKELVDSSVERYLQRRFTDLSVNFGCTGGQHRSVYSADAIARHLNNKYGVKVILSHREQGIETILPAKDVDVVFDSFLRDTQKPYNPENNRL